MTRASALSGAVGGTPACHVGTRKPVACHARDVPEPAVDRSTERRTPKPLANEIAARLVAIWEDVKQDDLPLATVRSHAAEVKALGKAMTAADAAGLMFYNRGEEPDAQ